MGKIMSKKGLPPGAYEGVSGEDYVPYIEAHEEPAEFSWLAVGLGVILAIVFGAANAYLGLKVGMTVSASIPAAVVSMALLRGVFGKGTVLENNTAQTVGSAGESLAAGVIFTVPALILMGVSPSLAKIFFLSLLGGWLGILFMVPLRRFLIVREHGVLPYPEGTACAEVLVAGDTGGRKAKTVFAGVTLGALYKLLMDKAGFHLWKDEVEWHLPGMKGGMIGFDVLPALVGVGFIIGPQIAAFMLAGAVLGWLVFIPLISTLGAGLTDAIYPATKAVGAMGAWDIWNYYIRYIGAGAVAVGGVVSLIKSMPTIWDSFRVGFQELLHKGSQKLEARPRTDQDLPMAWVVGGVAIIGVAVWSLLMPKNLLGVVGTFLVLIFAFFFVTVSSRIVGIVGSSSNPASGMTIATLLATSLILVLCGYSGMEGKIAAISIGAIVCIAICIAGDTSQDLKTGFLVGSTPRRQQMGELVGVLGSAAFVGLTLYLLHSAYGIGSKELAAPQASLMKMVVEGVMEGTLPWGFVLVGVFSGLVVELLGVPCLPFAVGLYLPIHLSTPVMLGGLVRAFFDRSLKGKEKVERREDGILYSSGLIAGEALLGVLMALVVSMKLKLSEMSPFGTLGDNGSFFVFLLLVATFFVLWKRPLDLEDDDEEDVLEAEA